MLKKFVVSLLICLALVSCSISPTGASEAGIGYSSETKMFLYHEVEGDKEGKTAEFKIDVDPLMDLLLRYKGATGITPDSE